MARLLWLFSALVVLLSVGAGTASPHTDVKKRDDNLPARVPYVFPEPGTDPIADHIRERRTNGTLLDLDGALLNAPLIAQAWDQFFGVIRDNNTLPPTMRELFILRVGTLNNAAYEWLQHESPGRSAGLTTEQLLVIRLAPPFLTGMNVTDIMGPDLTAALLYADWMTKSVHVPDEVFNGLRQFLNDTQMVEATATAGGYNLVSRFVEALNVDGKMDVQVPVPT
ncbi:4-carboxymuconolactone decarboxylase [Dendrothele bispora CBS 962.96]|uniref:4-carboxymuconolactone decarboxylase n=1 Tax=Dendrothele bispora (strain CBS 962.96) TaxID=1314807 RepID=A0A4V4HFL2_DENBC|nr:4-carboxymuconolactone decarboxylase [Dendrothele bispora CBS 962.96]